jgi:hypothetical protein
MSPNEAMKRVDTLLSHVWMVRTFLKHSEEAADDDELCDVHRTLYDYMRALGGPLQNGDAEVYIRQAKKKLRKLIHAKEFFLQIRPEISSHTNFEMAAKSLSAAVQEIEEILNEQGRTT